MPSTTPPKGRPTPGRRDRNVAARRSRSRTTAKKFVWAVIAVMLIGAILVLGTGTGSEPTHNTPGVNVVLPLLALRWVRVRPAPRS
ncbi:MAG: hypothetical protein U5K30_11705 [Acidimicrobiales bacterium]|nr:hypothetical protein [Acidimicrobiales bacterium]